MKKQSKKLNTNTAEQGKSRDYAELRPWQFKPGQSGNPKGKAKGTVSLKEFAKRYLQTLTDEEKIEYMKGLDKDIVWKMAEGNPKNDLDLNATVSISNVLDEIEHGSTLDNKELANGESLQDQGQEEEPDKV